MPRLRATISSFIADRTLCAVSPHDSVAAAVALMKERRVDCVVVTDDGALVGIFTERDFLNRVVAQELVAADIAVAEVMTREPETLSPVDSIAYAINRMALGGFRNVPIVDAGRCVAVVDVRDVMSQLSEVFEEIADDSSELSPWTDVGGG
jgi:CBS domain-containing protein